MNKKRYFVCPHCGAEVKSDAKGCQNCGSDEKTGWSEETYLDGLGIPADDDEYSELYDNEFGTKKNKNRRWIAVTGFVILIVFIVLLLIQR